MATVLALAVLLVPVAASSKVPNMKWGQSKQSLFISFMVKSLDRSSVVVRVSDTCSLSFTAESTKGWDHAVTLDLREDVNASSMKWEVAARPGKWGDVVVVTLDKVNKHRWDMLVMNPQDYKGRLDADWTREDESLEPLEEDTYLSESEGVKPLTRKSLAKYLKTSHAVIVNVRYPWCDKCKLQDAIFAKVAKGCRKMSKKDKAWLQLTWAVLDAREERDFARQFEPTCDSECLNWHALEVGEPAQKLEIATTETELLIQVERFRRPAVTELKDASEGATLTDTFSLVLARLPAKEGTEYRAYKRVAERLRGEAYFAVVFNAKAPYVEVFSVETGGTYKYEDSFEDVDDLGNWTHIHLLPLLVHNEHAVVKGLDKLRIPVAQLWLTDEQDSPEVNNTELNAKVEVEVMEVAKQFVGQLAFRKRTAGPGDSGLGGFGLMRIKSWPRFGIQSSASIQDSVKYALDAELDFAKAPAESVRKIKDFCSRVLAGTWPAAQPDTVPNLKQEDADSAPLVNSKVELPDKSEL